MDFNSYQKQALTTAHVDDQYKGTIMESTIWAMGVSGEAGEIIEKWKKLIAYNGGQLSDDDIDDFSKELGDVLWYVAVFAQSIGLSLGDVVDQNVSKLKDRQNRGVITGKGDNR